MKKFNLLYLAAFSLIFASCSKEATTAEESNFSTTNTVNRTAQTIDSPEFTPKASLDNTSEGLYHGIFSSRDFTHKGKIYINVANDGNYNASLTLLSGKKIEFSLSQQKTLDLSNLEFVSKDGTVATNASFTIDATDSEGLVATKVTIAGKEAYIAAYKEKSYGRVMVALGTYVDSTDPLYTGNWDMVAGPEMINYGGTMIPRINDVIPSNPGGFAANDTNAVFETFDFSSCIMGATSVQAAMDLNFLIGANQTSTFAGKDVTWNVNYNGTYRSNDCLTTTTGGTWSRDDGRAGTFVLN